MPNYLDGTLGHARRILGIHVRGRKNAQSKCVGRALSGKRFGDRKEVRQALASAARQCGSRRSAE